jgi:hypothetical protein
MRPPGERQLVMLVGSTWLAAIYTPFACILIYEVLLLISADRPLQVGIAIGAIVFGIAILAIYKAWPRQRRGCRAKPSNATSKPKMAWTWGLMWGCPA